jgi:hypothetical protein
MAVQTWQSRLTAKQNILSQKMVDQQVRNAGFATDVIIIRSNLDRVNDIVNLELLDIDVVNMTFPPMRDIPLRRFWGSGPTIIGYGTDTQANDSATLKKTEPFQCFAEVKYKIEQDSIILKFFDNPQGTNTKLPIHTESWILPLQVKDILGTFGGRSMIMQKINVAYLDQTLPDSLMAYVNAMATRRNILGW